MRKWNHKKENFKMNTTIKRNAKQFSWPGRNELFVKLLVVWSSTSSKLFLLPSFLIVKVSFSFGQ